LSRILACDPVRPDSKVIDQAATALVDGLAVVMPTETQYSLSVRADHDRALKKICAVKKRLETVKAALFIKDLEMARHFCEVNETARKLAHKFLPGPLTLILPGRKDQTVIAPGFLSADGFGIRISSSPIIAAVMERVPFAVTATSANISGREASATIADIEQSLGDSVDLYLDAGPCRSMVPSTVVKVAETVDILRVGKISESEITRCLEEEN
jgi:L-threonylcarbamoyladenylate synthase